MASQLTVDTIVGATSAGTVKVPGAIIQTVHGKLTGQVAVAGTSGNDRIVDIGLSATITPKFSNSKIIINVTLYMGADQSNASGYIQSYFVYKAGSGLTETMGDGVGGRRQCTGLINLYSVGSGNTSSAHKMGQVGGMHMDSNVGTTNATTYSVHCRCYSGGPTVYVNRSQSFQTSGTDYDPTPQSTITLQEVAQ